MATEATAARETHSTDDHPEAVGGRVSLRLPLGVILVGAVVYWLRQRERRSRAAVEERHFDPDPFDELAVDVVDVTENDLFPPSEEVPSGRTDSVSGALDRLQSCASRAVREGPTLPLPPPKS
ncbi:hypothetical protein VB773_22305 [Haloarculaceae archaeon H-GB2-1]|nr:hypothetical protein [Haloarculaceae archaeon H-GB1-1]MEA5389513.1 hypothetical protein [Haloarculaceae archaeon H-GB11]MEA5410033.1 hypothetical protein [Haloarculaceae archaeon H-GB2-1]